MQFTQPGILAPLPTVGRYVFFSVRGNTPALHTALSQLRVHADGLHTVVAIGPALVQALASEVPGLRPFPALLGVAPAHSEHTDSALCLWLRGEERGELLLSTRRLVELLAPAFALERVVDAFRHGHGPNGYGRDLTGYEDGTENPVDTQAVAAACLHCSTMGLHGSSFLALQQWEHNMPAFHALPPQARDHAIGRRLSDNEELDKAPESAHVKRTAQESFSPEAFVLRRSMPWWENAADGKDRMGLMFAAFGHSLDAFEVQWRRMLGLDDGLADALFQFSQPRTGSYYWCPPLQQGQLDLRLLGV
ncbi:MAG: Dyp-type peroxidase [Acidovorax sp.]|nr:Dyp-type peroxidase [Acidovorax sp.]